MDFNKYLGQLLAENDRMNKETLFCVFYFSAAANKVNINESEAIERIIEILEKYEINYNICSGVENAFNIGRKWITTMPIECYVESTGVYPIDWSTEELVTLQTLDENGEIIIMIAPAKR